MAKQFLANRSGQTPTLDEVPNETIKIYPTEAALDADLANLEENEIVATDEDNNPASGTQYPVDIVQDGNMHAVTSNAVYDFIASYMANQNTLSDEETISLSTSSSSPTIMEYDGFLIVKCESSTSNQYTTISINGRNTSISKTSGGQNVVMTYPFTKGDRIYIVGQGNMSGAYTARQYKLRDYTGR